MTNNRTQGAQYAEWLEREQSRLRALKLGHGSYAKLGKHLDVNPRYLQEFLVHEIVPTNKDARKRMGLKPPATSKGAKIYQALNEKAQAAGWGSWSEYRRAVQRGVVDLSEKNLYHEGALRITKECNEKPV